MKVLLDTSTLVAGMLRDHPHKVACRPWILAVRDGLHEGVLCSHSLAEFYATMTAMPLKPQLSPSETRQTLEELLTHFEIVPLLEADYLAALDLVTSRLLRSGAIFDALHEIAARKAAADRLVTVNVAHFERFRDDVDSWIIDPRRTAP
ncbi:MAG: PIN domain-containing protein [Vulcanimicrobiota bacterium]